MVPESPLLRPLDLTGLGEDQALPLLALSASHTGEAKEGATAHTNDTKTEAWEELRGVSASRYDSDFTQLGKLGEGGFGRVSSSCNHGSART